MAPSTQNQMTFDDKALHKISLKRKLTCTFKGVSKIMEIFQNVLYLILTLKLSAVVGLEPTDLHSRQLPKY